MEDGAAAFSVEQVLSEAVSRMATDVHIYPRESELRVDFRISGRVFNHAHVNPADHNMVRRIKALAGMNLAETRMPQDGAFETFTNSGMFRFRAATLPTAYGEAVSLRVLPYEMNCTSLHSLGMCESDVAAVTRVLQGPPGLVITCGATGTGKTTTLYVMMQELARSGLKVLSIEDPVEIRLADCHQVQVCEAAGLTYDVGLRSLLRHDPDVIMVGEIRDDATAKTVVRASLTGHMVLTSTHSRDVVGTLARLQEFGASRVEMAEVLRCIIVQTAPFHADGQCQPTVQMPFTFEVWPVSPELAQVIAERISWSAVRHEWTRRIRGGGRG